MKNDNSMATYIFRLLTGSLSSKGQRQLIDKARMRQVMRQQWDAPHAANPDDEKTGEEIYRSIERRIAGEKRVRPLLGRGWRGYAAAAVAGLVIGLAGYLLYQWTGYPKPHFVEIAAVEPTRHVLPDSSVVWIERGSGIRYLSEFKEGRDVKLSGSALFEVTKDARHPFKVYVDRGTIEVKGTVFQVDHKKSGKYDISLFEGKIDFMSQASGKRTSLLPSQTILYNPENGAVFKETLTDDITWKDGYFSFRNVRIDRLISAIDKLYDAEIRIKADVSPQTAFSGSFHVDEDINDIASQICYLMNLRKYDIDDKTIILY
ncbi:MAG: FecR domain-containing protein [Mediterranea sp.]|jgi:ferric-dicitrate binding protein FerR (iron transport regulator)|nr:FecR domain-containing protein [Mediterranea sp.]